MKMTFIKSLGFALLAGFAIASCNTDPCKDVVCGDFGTCVEGECACDAGYEQDANGACTVLTVSKFTGSFDVVEDCENSAAAAYIAGISATTNVNEIAIINFWEFFTNPVIATVSGTTVTIAEQEPDNDLFFVSGSGELDPTTGDITFTYTVTEKDATGAVVDSDTCNSTVYNK